MGFPKTFHEMKAMGYRFDNDATCRGCGDDIEWWITPNGKKIPMNPMTSDHSEAKAHWSTCTEQDSFRRRA
jgi:hypothetical protein